MTLKKPHIGTALFALLLASAIAYSLFEYNILSQRANTEDIKIQSQLSVKSASERFDQFLYNFNNESSRFTDFVISELARGTDHSNILAQTKKNYHFWQFVIYEDGLPIIWDGFADVGILDSTYLAQQEISLHLKTRTNVSALEARLPITDTIGSDTTNYHVFTSVRVAQDNILSIGENLNLTPSQLFSKEKEYPVRFQLSDVEPLDAVAQTFISTPSQDTAGFIFAYQDDFPTYTLQLTKKQEKTRGLYLSIIIMLFTLLVFQTSASLSVFQQFMLRSVTLAGAWWALHTSVPLFGTNPLGLAPNSVFIFYLEAGLLLVAGSVLLSYLSVVTPPQKGTQSRAVLTPFLTGLLIPTFFAKVLFSVYHQVFNGTFYLFKQTLQETWPSFIFMFVTGTAILGLITLVLLICRRILMNQSQLADIGSFSFLSGSMLSLGTLWIVYSKEYPNWLLLVIVASFSTPVLLAVLQAMLKIKLHRVSLLRAFMVLNVISSFAFFSVGYLSTKDAEPERLAKASRQFILESEQNIQQITTQLLGRIHFAATANPSFNPLIFDEIVAASVDDSWMNYSISAQLIDEDGSLLADYTTDLSAPQWSTEFSVQELIIPFEGERIRRNNLRPVIRPQPINTINAEFSSFRRGWIPIYESAESDDITSWILVSVYKQLPETNRPLRSVITTTYNTKSPTISLVEYEDRAPIRQSTVGTPGTIPGYSHLPETISRNTFKDSTYRVRSIIRGLRLNEHYARTSGGTIVRAASFEITFTQSLYAFLRMYLILAVPFILILLGLGLQNKWAVFGSSRRIRDRMVDRFLLASLLCLFALVGITYFILDQENTKTVQSELLSRLNDLVSNIENRDQSNQTNSQYLENVASILSEDAAIYVNARLVSSTTPQIYSQHLLPSSIPWEVYQNIMVNGSEQEVSFVQLNDFDMMIGYQPWFNAQNQIAGIVAMPTFQRAPKFYDQVLSTVSYLLAFFSLIFGILMLSIGVIATHMTYPLETLRGALMDISKGDLETRLPVTGNDEIGLLTRAYNAMTQRLKELQEELAKTEREAAWKEMAQQVAHEIKNPLTPMKLNLQHLERQLQQTGNKLGESNPRILNITQSMIEQIDALNNIASDFSKFAKPIQHQFAPMVVNDLVQSVADLYRHESDFDMTVETAPHNMVINGVTDELRRCLVNLIKNGKEAMENGGTITLKTQHLPEKKQVQITVSDTGSGISEENLANIFAPNFSTKTSGTGLGLAITKKIIEEHGGEISFTSEAGKGTTFHILLPLISTK